MQTPKRNNYYQNQDQFNRFQQKCVCQICNCGKHHCPPTAVKFNGETTNHHDYKAYNITAQKHQPCQHVYNPRHYNPQDLKTSYKKDYQPFTVEPKPQLHRYQYPKNTQPFYGETEYTKSYLPHQIVVDRPHTTTMLPTNRNRPKFQGTTTYQQQYSPKKVQKSQVYHPVYQKKHIPFNGETSYHAQFKPYQVQAKKPTVQHYQYPQRQNKFLGQSRYNEQYKSYKIQMPKGCPIQVMPQRPRQCSPGKNHLQYSAQKHRWQ